LELVELSEVKLTSPTLIAALPDMGNVAGMAMEHLIKILGSEPVAEIRMDHPPFVVHHGGYAQFSRVTYKVYADKGNGLLLFSGGSQPPSSSKLYELCETLVGYAQRLGVKRVISLGGAYAEDMGEEPRVFGSVNRKELLEELRERGILELQGQGRITGFNGLILGIAFERGMDGICLLGEIDNPNVKQPGTSARVLQTLGRLLGLQVDVAELFEEDRKIREHLRVEHKEPERRLKPRYVS